MITEIFAVVASAYALETLAADLRQQNFSESTNVITGIENASQKRTKRAIFLQASPLRIFAPAETKPTVIPVSVASAVTASSPYAAESSR